ncbi:hypothetical protein FRACYDRAFT_268149, partial [Fragilariopsis cylindrus CCMP1102]
MMDKYIYKEQEELTLQRERDVLQGCLLLSLLILVVCGWGRHNSLLQHEYYYIANLNKFIKEYRHININIQN